jgi:hypothetical protein
LRLAEYVSSIRLFIGLDPGLAQRNACRDDSKSYRNPASTINSGR